MTLLVISPDYASHLLPLATLASAWQDAGEPVVVATGPATAPLVTSFGYQRIDLSLGRGSNPGVIRADRQPAGEDASLRGFFAATRRGMVATLRYQAEARRTDLLWQPVESARRVLDVLDAVQPDHILVDHLAFSARIALHAAGIPYGDVVLGHPSALPVGAEVYGYPTVWPAAFRPSPTDLADLHGVCCTVRDAFTADWNRATAALNRSAPPVPDAFQVHGDLLLFNYPADLHPFALPPRSAGRFPGSAVRFLGSAVRAETADGAAAAWLASADRRPIVAVSFGSFLSARADVLARVVAALRPVDVRVALATGSADPAVLGPLPAHWLVGGFLPQVAILRRAALAITHGGNNSVTEALTFGVPMLVLPFSTDQFAGAAAIESTGVGAVLDPNDFAVDELRAAALALLADASVRAVADKFAAGLAMSSGPDLAFAAVRSAA